MDELTVVMRSLNMSPTIAELRAYMKSKNGKMSFADFLDIMHQHSTKVINGYYYIQNQAVDFIG